MSPRRWWAVALLLWTGAAGCEGCLNLDEYTLVPPGFDVSGGGGSGAGSVGGGGEGGASASCDEVAGDYFVTLPIATSSGIGPCDDPLVAGARVYALDPLDGDCVAWAGLEAEPSTTLDVSARIVHREDGVLHVAGGYVSGGLTLPASCSDGSDVVLTDPSPQAALFVARLERDGSGFCTAWSRIATAPGAPFTVTAIEADGAGTVSVAGVLGGQTATFSSGAGNEELTGSAFVVHYRVDGTLDALTPFVGGEGDGVRGIDAVAGDWLFAGALRDEDPACQGCAGESHVANPATDCAGMGGSGTGGMGVGGAGGGIGGAGGGVATENALNAMLWRWGGPGDLCQDLVTYGTDGDSTDAQIMYDVDARQSGAGCVTHVAGLAGTSSWRLGADPSTALFDAGGTTSDGFVARFSGASGACGPGGQLDWSLRLSAMTGTSWAHRVATDRCGDGAVVGAFVDASAPGGLVAHRCTPDGTCDSDAAIAIAGGNRLLTLGLAGDGTVSWQGSLGPVATGSQTIAGAPAGQLRDTLVTDNRDQIAVLLEASGPLETDNVDDSGCPVLVAFPQAGRYVVALDPEGAGDGQARCVFAAGLP